MTVPEFRRQMTLVARMREILADPVMQHALETLKNSNPPIDADPADDPIVSARILSQMTGYRTHHDTLISLSEPLSEPVQLEASYQPET